MIHKTKRSTSSSATSIGTEENSLGVLKVQTRALIYMEANKHSHYRRIQVQRAASLLSKYSFKKGDGHQEASDRKVSIMESACRKSDVSHYCTVSRTKRNRNIMRGTVSSTGDSSTSIP